MRTNKQTKKGSQMKNLQAKSVEKKLTAFFNKVEEWINAPISIPGEEDYITPDRYKDELMYSFNVENSNNIMLGTDGLLLDLVESGSSDGLNLGEFADEFYSLLDDTNWTIEHENYGLLHLYKEVA